MSSDRPFYCKTNHSDPMLYTQVALTIAFAVSGFALMLAKQWKLALVLISSAVFSGIFANTVLQIRLNTDSCYNKTYRILYLLTSLFTVFALISWALLSMHLLDIVNLDTAAMKKERTAKVSDTASRSEMKTKSSSSSSSSRSRNKVSEASAAFAAKSAHEASPPYSSSSSGSSKGRSVSATLAAKSAREASPSYY